jgi:NDP-hexose C3-ketoreductase / dTDP-4-oxo-2-deoxy-alpha-D-pentos-2-ene 2,3-reductase
MQYKQLGRSGLKVSRLCMGTMNFGWVTDEAAGLSLMESGAGDGNQLLGYRRRLQ